METSLVDICKVYPSDKVAVICDNGEKKETLNYTEFLKLARRLSSELQSRINGDVEEKVAVGVYCDVNVYLPVVIYALLSYQAVFVPLPLKASTISLISMLKKCGIQYILVHKEAFSLFIATLKKELTISREYDIESIACYVLVELNVEAVSLNNDISYIVQSSGTTNIAKSIMVPQNCVIPNIKDLRNIFRVTSNDIIFIASSLTFDASIIQMLLTWSSNSSMVLVPLDVICNPLILCSALKNNCVTVIQCTPSLLLLIGQKLLKKYICGSKSSLRVLALGGERMLSKDIMSNLFADNELLQVFNIYGTSEVSAWASIYKVKLLDIKNTISSAENAIDWVPIGTPLSNTILKLYDEYGNIVVNAGSGEIWIGSKDRVCRIDEDSPHIILNDIPILRRTGDIGEIINNEIYYCGRINDQVKRNGQLINLDLLKQAVERINKITSCVCLYIKNKENLLMQDNLLLYACVSCEDVESEELERKIIEVIRSELSTSYLPEQIIFIRDIPITSHGKINKNALQTDKTNILKQNPILKSFDEQLSHYWRLTLNSNEAPKGNDNFVKCGGDSFTVAFLVNKLTDFMKNFAISYEKLFNIILTATFQDVSIFLENALYISSTKTKTIESLKCVENLMESDKLLPVEHKHFKALSRQDKTFECACNDINLVNILNFTHSDTLEINMQWKYDLKKCIDASPLVVLSNSLKDDVVYIGSHSHIFTAISLLNGMEIWKQTLGDRVESSATISKDGNFICVGCYDGVLYIFDRYHNKIIWEYSTDDAIKSSPCTNMQNDILVTGSHDQHIYALDIRKKQCLWKIFFGSSCFSSPLVDEKRQIVYVSFLCGDMYALVIATGKIHWKVHFDRPIFSSPCLCSTFIAVGCVDGVLYTVDFEGKKLWEFQTGAPIFSSPVCLILKTKEFILFGSNDKCLYCISSDGELFWKYETNAPIYASVAICRFNNKIRKEVLKTGTKRVYCNKSSESFRNSEVPSSNHVLIILASTNGDIFVLDAENGTSIATHTLPGEVFSSPVVIRNQVVVGCRDNNVYCLCLTCKDNT